MSLKVLKFKKLLHTPTLYIFLYLGSQVSYVGTVCFRSLMAISVFLTASSIFLSINSSALFFTKAYPTPSLNNLIEKLEISFEPANLSKLILKYMSITISTLSLLVYNPLNWIVFKFSTKSMSSFISMNYQAPQIATSNAFEVPVGISNPKPTCTSQYWSPSSPMKHVSSLKTPVKKRINRIIVTVQQQPQ